MKLSILLSILAVLICASTLLGQNAAQRAAAVRNQRLQPTRVVDTTESEASAVPESFAAQDEGNQWFQEFRLFPPRYVGPFRYTHPMISRRTLVQGTNRWIWTDSANYFRAEQTRFGAGFSPRAATHRWRR